MTDAPILMFDGVCNLCNGAVRFVIEHDPPPGRFRFAALQSEAGRHLLERFRLPADALDSVVLVEGARVSMRSTAALRVLALLGLPWSVLAVLFVVPRRLRDALYDWIARHRYGWFGRRETCMVPTAEIRSRFLG